MKVRLKLVTSIVEFIFVKTTEMHNAIVSVYRWSILAQGRIIYQHSFRENLTYINDHIHDG